jgi:transcriptional regulator with XRE-family HTH domain
MEASTNVFGEMMRALRHERGWSLAQAAEASGGRITMQGIGRLETGDRHPGSRTLSALAAAYEVTFRVDADGITIEA